MNGFIANSRSNIGMGVTYRDSDSSFIEKSTHGMWTAGDRCPDVILRKSDGTETRLYTEIGYGKYLALFVGMEPPADFGFQNLVTLFNIQPTVTQPTSHEDGATDGKKTYTADWAREDDPVVVLVRPDMHIAHVGRDVAGAHQYLSAIYTR